MKPSRYAASRQKACQACVAAKAKCDRRAVRCSRCGARGLPCVYPPAVGRQTDARLGVLVDAGEHEAASEELSAAVVPSPDVEDQARPRRAADCLADDALDVVDGELVCPINADGISMRWMNAYVPTPEQTVKAYQPSTMSFVRRVLKAYAGMAVRGRGIPPFIHPAQIGVNTTTITSMRTAAGASSTAITTCLSLARICDATLAGGSRTTADAAAAVLMREMDRIYASQQDQQGQQGVDHLASLSVFQAYLLYALVLFFQLERQADPFLRQAIVALQEIACTSARRGLVCAAEQQQQQHTCRPRWAAWIVAEAKRRTLYTMYLFDSVLSAHDGLPTYLGTELRGLPAPGSKALWQAQSLPEWTKAYSMHLDDWAEAEATEAAGPTAGCGYDTGSLRIDELWPIPVGTDAAGLARRRRRVDQWLESVDEYGTMMYAVTGSTHEG